MKFNVLGEIPVRKIRSLIWVFFMVGLVGCETLGPASLRGGRNDYNDAINQTDVEEFLLNVVRLRYNAKPYVLGIASISAKSQFQADISASHEYNKADFYENRAGMGLRYSENPNIIYQPLRGRRFVIQLLSPLDLETIFLLRFSGWEMSSILRVFARSINEVPNAPTGGDSTPKGVPEYKDFLKAINAMAELEHQGAITYALKEKKRKWWKDKLGIRILPKARDSTHFRTVTRIFKLDPEANQYVMKIGWPPGDDDELIIETRPIVSAMFYVGRSIDIPDALRTSGVAHFNLDENGEPFDWDKVLQGLIKIRSSSTRPDNTYATVKYGDYWYYIDNKDISSKETFTMLNVVFTLQSAGDLRQGPVLTIPVD